MKVIIPKRTDAKFSGNFRAILDRFVTNRTHSLRTMTVGVIESFDKAKQIATISPGIKSFKLEETEDNIVYESYEHPLLVNVPVVFPGGGDWHLTFPVKKGDECLLLCADRDISIWKKFGGVRDPRDRERHHSIKDAVAIVGINPQEKALVDYNDTEPELRNRDGSTKITLGSSGLIIKGNLTVEGTIESSGAISSDGAVNANAITPATQVSLGTHLHAGTGVPPTPGT